MKDGTAFLRFFDDISKMIVGGQHECINILVACTFSVWKPQSAPDRLFPQDFRRGCSQRNDCVKIVDIPPFFENIDVDHDFHGIVRIFHFQ